MKTECLREVKNNLSRIIEGLPKTGPILITRSGKASALLLPIDEDTDLEALLLSTSSRFRKLFDRATRSRKWTPLDEVP